MLWPEGVGLLKECVAPQVFRHRETGEWKAGPCQSWRCPGCGKLLARRWRAVLNWAARQGFVPEYFITLTVRQALPLWREAVPLEQPGPAEQRAGVRNLARMLSQALSRLVAEIRRQYGSFQYIAFVELTTGRRTPGHRPHLLVQTKRPVPRRWLSGRWEFHTRGSFRVDVQRLRSPAQAANYLVRWARGRRSNSGTE